MHVGPAGVPSCSLNISQMAISGEPVEKLFLWGHSACTLGNADHDYKVLIFGGFGGHRHAAAVVGSKIYVFAGLTDNAISSSLHVLDTDNLQWKELSVSGEWPCARHSHSMVACGSQIYMFGGYNGKKILGDLYSFDVHKCLWKKEEVAGKSPHARFADWEFTDFNQDSHSEAEPIGVNDGHQMVASHWVLQLDRKYAKLGKDILKKFGWLDLGRKAYLQGDGTHICFPVTENFCVVFHEKQHHFGDKSEALNNFIGEGKPFTGESILLNEIPSSTALHLLKECGATKQWYDVVEVRRASKSPLNTMTEAVASLLQRKGLSATLLEQLPSRAKAKLVYACEWNPHAFEALKYNLQANSVSDRWIVLEGDNRIIAPKGVADRVCLGLITTSENSWVTAIRALRTEDGMLHVHGNVKDSGEGLWTDHVSKSISEIAIS
ncbi:hypothetical protein Q3G72_007287 [Acer saccharum]|nr:hypothetical protein Q3G72_007287 [Acer saccharum]